MANLRYENLIPNTRDIVDCIIPNIAANFGIHNCVAAIPQEIRMRRWDCDKRDHIKEESEDDPRNWGVQFLKELLSISRIKKENGETVEAWYADLKRKMQKNLAKKNGDKHPWVRLADVKWLREHYQSGASLDSDEEGNEVVARESSSDNSTSEGSEMAEYIAEAQEFSKKPGHPSYVPKQVSNMLKRRRAETPPLRKSKRWQRQESASATLDQFEGRKKARRSIGGYAPRNTATAFNAEFDFDDDPSFQDSSTQLLVPAALPTPSDSSHPFEYNTHAHSYSRHRQAPASDIANDDEETSLYQLQLELEVAEAELKAAKLRLRVVEGKRRAAAEMESNQDTLEENISFD
ncbi:hypothetical protein P154DRAFT_583172 [Amniculicola lignicola CBS 123094]|uniref:Uncharacterized protein n=1 Tax=Amniculicola lignicola CBS 123094 TaxID=1392246 RepID=A0A6A5W5Z7_9PLEO|nr:hypothetical protein P154DRAFT_583172 [Amniculicola lignicola CBS 123094]